MRLWNIFLPALAVLTAIAAPALAEAPDGQQIFLHGNSNGALPCAACHGMAGQGNTAIGAPKLAGLSQVEITGALAAFASGKAEDPVMRSIAAALSPPEIQAVSAYLAGLGK